MGPLNKIGCVEVGFLTTEHATEQLNWSCLTEVTVFYINNNKPANSFQQDKAILLHQGNTYSQNPKYQKKTLRTLQ